MVQPLQTGRQIIPSDVNHIVDGRTVFARKETQEELVILVDGPVGLCIDVVEI